MEVHVREPKEEIKKALAKEFRLESGHRRICFDLAGKIYLSFAQVDKNNQCQAGE